MTAVRTKISAGLLAFGMAVAAAAPAFGATFVAWRVGGVSKGDLLNVRAYPSSGSRILVGYPNGTVLSMTGKCTGGVNLASIQNLAAWKQRQMVRYEWCQAWLDPTGSGDFRPGWVYGRYLRPA